MQYEIPLPADYDMGVIRRRVAERGHRTDAFPGLGVKAYAIREKGVAGSPVNEYAPFYLWADPAGMDEFLFGPAFSGIVSDFGRPVVRHWRGLGFELGPDRDIPATAATRASRVIPTDRPLPELVEEARARLTTTAAAPGVHSAAVVVDPAGWELLEFTLWAQEPPPAQGDRYQVLHTSTPHLAGLVHGRPE
nr:DUF4865 family protein [Motilibacter deserti]